MLPKTISKELKGDGEDTKPIGIQLEEPPTTTGTMSFSKFKVCAAAAVLISVVLVVGVFGSIILYGKYAKQDDEIVYRTFEDDGVQHSIEIITNDVDRVETVVFEKIDNVTEGGTLMYDFNTKMIVAYSDKDDACYVWVNETLDWENRDWLFSGDSPSYTMNRNDEIPSMFLKQAVADEIADKCFGVKSYWTTETTDRHLSTEGNSRQKRGTGCCCCCCWRHCCCKPRYCYAV